MYSSLISGDSTYHLQDAQTLCSSIAKQAERLDAISKRIQELATDDSLKTLHLQATIRRATSQYIKDCLLMLPSLPSPAELERIRRNRTAAPLLHTAVTSVKKVAVTTGWSPDNVTGETVPDIASDDDPLIQQINIVRNYIEQARKVERFEEVAALQENLNMLKDMYRNREMEAGKIDQSSY